MNSAEVLKATHHTTNMVIQRYLSDLTDADLLVRPGTGCNHIAWQLGHLIASNAHMLELLYPGAAPALPEGFVERHNDEAAASDKATDFYTKAEYDALLNALSAAVDATLDNVTDAELDRPSPEGYRSMFPTYGNMLVLIVSHALMHAGQWVPVRRTLGKPYVI